MFCHNQTENYFDYKCYYELKDYYDTKIDNDTAKKFLIEYTIPTSYNHILKTSPLITKLTENLASDRFSFKYNRAMLCKYINYWLNTEIKNHNLNESYIEFFKSFADEFAKHKNGHNSYKYNTCRNNFSLLEKNKYYRMQGLYDMYRLYNEIIIPKVQRKKEVNICSNLMAINKSYKDLAWEHQGDDDLNKNLEKFKNLALIQAKRYVPECRSNLLEDIEKLQLVYSASQKRSDVQEIKVAGQGQSETDTGKGLQKTEFPPKHTQVPEASDERTLSELKRKTTEQPHQREVTSARVESYETVIEPEEVVPPAKEPREQLHRSKFKENILLEPQLYKSALLSEPRSFEDGTRYNEQYAENQGSPSDGIFNKMSEALSGFMSNVDPVPVVGVSEEEEDAYIEFPVVSMDHSQEDFQDMKNMMVGILDMVQ
ncbi:hypothetical protein PVIIG_06164 [Plasmodium vivax India VII]|uniref:VIR protein n=1 Tax=Plasmodium vivax India VII TaxID=1077284 RepID=A0A0J9SHG7_PLAVI|nr:hypothetical protein PVIIG_06164 [Plasmodium vivax India VII]